MKKRETQLIWLTIAASSLTILIGFGQLFISHHQHAVQAKSTIAVTRPAAKPKAPTPVKIDWHQPSMRKAYPTLSNYADLNIQASIKQQRVYLKNNDHGLYTMRASTGKQGSETPRGHFEIQPERGLHFFNAQSGEGANYWVSFKDHGIYLFHSVPVDENNHYIKSEAEQLGKVANSHGCIRLSIADAKWLYENIPTHTPVVIS